MSVKDKVGNALYSAIEGYEHKLGRKVIKLISDKVGDLVDDCLTDPVFGCVNFGIRFRLTTVLENLKGECGAKAKKAALGSLC